MRALNYLEFKTVYIFISNIFLLNKIFFLYIEYKSKISIIKILTNIKMKKNCFVKKVH